MKKCYVAIGSQSCRILKEFAASNTGSDTRYIYIDTNAKNDPIFSESDCRILFDDYPYRSGYMRAFGRDMFKMRLYSGDFPEIFDSFYDTDSIDICLVTTSFGGFGSAVVFEFADYMCAKISRISSKKAKISIRTVAFSKKQFDRIFEDREQNATAHELNEYGFVCEARERAAVSSSFFDRNEVFLIYSPYLTRERLGETLSKTREELMHDDIKDSYDRLPEIPAEDVFISFSTRDQGKADALVNLLNQNSIGTWISSRNMKSGDYPCQIAQAIKGAKVFVVLISESSLQSRHVKSEVNLAFDQRGKNLLIPLFIDGSDLDDSFGYYLNTTQHFHADRPPLEATMAKLCREIKTYLESNR